LGWRGAAELGEVYPVPGFPIRRKRATFPGTG
jgi:hypothetical protein